MGSVVNLFVPFYLDYSGFHPVDIPPSPQAPGRMNENFARIVYCRNDLGSLYQYLYQYIDVPFVAAPDLNFPRIFTDLAMTVPRRSP